MNKELMVEAEFLSHLKDNKATVEEELKQIKKQIDHQEQKLVNMMVDQELQSFKGNNGITYSLKTMVAPNVLAENKPELIKRLKENGHAGIVKEDVNAQTFKAYIKEMGWETNEELPEFLNDIVTIFEKTTIGTRRN